RVGPCRLAHREVGSRGAALRPTGTARRRSRTGSHRLAQPDPSHFRTFPPACPSRGLGATRDRIRGRRPPPPPPPPVLPPPSPARLDTSLE
ncbi:hypothetical protein U9M48_018467, partial [Paspalum notatum var. saurae]